MNIRPMGLERETGAILKKGEGRYRDISAEHPLMKKRFEWLRANLPLFALQTTGLSEAHDVFLQNGARLYRDSNGHIEYANAEAPSVRTLLAQRQAGLLILASHFCFKTPQGDLVMLIGNDSAVDPKDARRLNAFGGAHENYLTDRPGVVHMYEKTKEYRRFLKPLLTHLITRIVYTGCGVVDRRTGAFLLSSRAPFLHQWAGDDAMKNRPFVFLRHEPLVGEELKLRYARLQIVAGEPNVAEEATYLAVGTTHLLLRLAEEHLDVYDDLVTLRSPLQALRALNADIDCEREYLCDDGRRHSAVEIQRIYRDAVAAHVPDRQRDPDFVVAEADDIDGRWGRRLDELENDPHDPAGKGDWQMKRLLLEQYLARKGVDGFSEIMQMCARKRDMDATKRLLDRCEFLAISYHSHLLSPFGVQPWAATRLTRITSDEEILDAVVNPPAVNFGFGFPEIRSSLRGKLLQLCEEHAVQVVPTWENMKIGIRAADRDDLVLGSLGSSLIRMDDPFDPQIERFERFKRKFEAM